jgi:hypothetical protein
MVQAGQRLPGGREEQQPHQSAPFCIKAATAQAAPLEVLRVVAVARLVVLVLAWMLPPLLPVFQMVEMVMPDMVARVAWLMLLAQTVPNMALGMALVVVAAV